MGRIWGASFNLISAYVGPSLEIWKATRSIGTPLFGCMALLFFAGSLSAASAQAIIIGPPLPGTGPQILNPYCRIPTYLKDDIGPRGLSTYYRKTDEPIIYIQSGATANANLLAFILAHECGHHLSGHLTWSAAFPLSADLLIPETEIEADCWAARAMLRTGNPQGIIAALQDANNGMLHHIESNPPAGMRIRNIRQCAGL